MRDPYDVLGVDRRADEGAIKSAFRKLAKTYHPDQNPGDTRAKERFAEVNQAYEIVGDKEKRAKFDRGEIDAEGKEKFSFGNGFGGGFGGPDGASPFDGGSFRFTRRGRGGAGGASGGMGGAGAGGTAEDILSEIFGGAFGGRQSGRSDPGPGPGGPGGDPFAGFGGPGGAARADRGADVETEVSVTIEDVIEGNRATAALPDGRKLAVSLPVGVRDGQVIRLRGQGEPVARTGPQGGTRRGDALVTVRFAPHPDYRPDGENLRVALEVPLEDAVLGAKLPVRTPAGRVAVTVPPMTGSDRTFRLKERGLPKDKSGRRGDLLVDVRVMVGEDGDGRLTELMRERRAAREAASENAAARGD